MSAGLVWIGLVSLGAESHLGPQTGHLPVWPVLRRAPGFEALTSVCRHVAGIWQCVGVGAPQLKGGGHSRQGFKQDGTWGHLSFRF